MNLVAQATQDAAKVQSLIKNANLLDTSEPLAGPTNVVYELWVNLSAILALQAHWSLRLENPAGSREVRLPMNPAKKSNFPYFVASDPTDGSDAFQICTGTKLASPTKDEFAPDFSIQGPSAGLDPGAADLVFCWDQKHTESSDRLDRDQVFLFSAQVRLIGPSSLLSKNPFETTDPWPNGDSIITNRDFSTLTDHSLKTLGVCEVAWADVGKCAKRRP